MASEELKAVIESVVSELCDIDHGVNNLVNVIDSHSIKRLEVLRDLVEEIRHLRFAVDRVGR